MKYKVGDTVKIRKDVTLAEIEANYFNGCQSDTMTFLRDASYNHFDKKYNISSLAGNNPIIDGYVVNNCILKKEILDEKETEYLSAIIKPFRNNLEFIIKYSAIDEEYIIIHLKKGGIALPNFKKGAMYKGMELNKTYTLKELGLEK